MPLSLPPLLPPPLSLTYSLTHSLSISPSSLFSVRSVFLRFNFFVFHCEAPWQLKRGSHSVADGLIESRTSPQTQKGFHGPTRLRCRIMPRDIPCCLSPFNIARRESRFSICSTRIVRPSVHPSTCPPALLSVRARRCIDAVLNVVGELFHRFNRIVTRRLLRKEG